VPLQNQIGEKALKNALRALGAFACLGVVSACGGGKDSETETATFSGSGFPFTFEYPGDWELTDDVTVDQSVGGAPDETIALGLDNDNAIVLQRFTLSLEVDEANLDRAKAEFDSLVQELDPEAIGAETGEIASYPSLDYESIALTTPAEGESRFIVLFEGDQEYLINCQSTPENREEVESACERALETLESTGG